MDVTQEYGIQNLAKASNEDKVQCTCCGLIYYEEITDERNTNSLRQFYDAENGEYFLGCPKCETDNYLLAYEKA